MTEPFADRFAQVRSAFGPLVWGLDPSGRLLESWGLGDTADGLDRFVDLAIEAAAGAIGLVKPQSAFYERHGWRGVRTLARLANEARQAGLLVILDAKRGDVGSTNDAYAEAYLGPDAPMTADALTVSPYLGLGAMDAFVERADRSGSCLLVVVRSSNPEGRRVQAARDESGQTVESALLQEIGSRNAQLRPGRVGPIGAVIGPNHMSPELDLVGANALFLAPGIGAQGATPSDVAQVFSSCPDRVMPSASRLLLGAGPDPGKLRAEIQALAGVFKELLQA
ncbi:MAG TPA: orotidine-5'-phosphate decarboxylase [Acidimicrobiales bacterium]|nr:orotidine-5'-phosphate decarboxylase [Acidimicrobiales bacterium]